VFSLVNEVGKLIDDRDEQRMNADMPMLVTPEGIIIDVRAEPSKAA